MLFKIQLNPKDVKVLQKCFSDEEKICNRDLSKATKSQLNDDIKRCQDILDNAPRIKDQAQVPANHSRKPITETMAFKQAMKARNMLKTKSFSSVAGYIDKQKELKRFMNYVDAMRYYQMAQSIEDRDYQIKNQGNLIKDAGNLEQIDPQARSLYRLNNSNEQKQDPKREKRATKSSLKRDLVEFIRKHK